MMYERIQKESIRLEQQIEEIRRKLQLLPAGKLICCTQKGKYQKWYQRTEKKKSYIPKQNRSLAEQLAVKNFLLAKLEDLEGEQRAIQFYLRHYPAKKQAEMLLTEDNPYVELLQPFFIPVSQELDRWMQEPYEKNTYHPELLVYKVGPLTVRSKSEAMIASALLIHRIPFRYECALRLGEKVIYPDFTIRHPKTGKVYYWEHFGLMDNADYAKSAGTKVQLYMSYNMIPSIKLITTYETKNEPMGPQLIEKIIDHYFL